MLPAVALAAGVLGAGAAFTLRLVLRFTLRNDRRRRSQVQESLDRDVKRARAQAKLCQWGHDDHPHGDHVKSAGIAVVRVEHLARDLVRHNVANHEIASRAGDERDGRGDELGLASCQRPCS